MNFFKFYVFASYLLLNPSTSENGALHACPIYLKYTGGSNVYCGDDLTIGDGSAIGDEVRIRYQTVFGKVTIGNYATIGLQVMGGDGAVIGNSACIDAKVVLVPGETIFNHACKYKTDDAGNYSKVLAQSGNRCYWHETEKNASNAKEGNYKRIN